MKSAAVFLNNSVIAAVLTIGIAALSLMNWYPLLTLVYKTYDMRQRLRQKKPVSPVVIVAIDDQSIQKLGRWPWPRAYMAELVDVLAESRPALIATNILYTEAGRNFGLAGSGLRMVVGPPVAWRQSARPCCWPKNDWIVTPPWLILSPGPKM